MTAYGNLAQFYDRLTDNGEYAKRCDYITDLLSENGVSGGILLDLACGTGNFSELFCQKGFDVIGVDISPDMLACAMEKSYDKGLDILYLCQDMAELDLYGTISCAVCTLDSFNHVTEPDSVRKAIKKVGLFMEKGGVFVFDVNTRYKHREVLANNTFVYDLDEIFCVWQNTLDAETDRVHIDIDLFAPDENGKYDRLEESFDEVIYDRETLEAWLKKYGFETVGVYEEFTRESVKPDTQRAVFVCKKIKQTNGFFKGILSSL